MKKSGSGKELKRMDKYTTRIDEYGDKFWYKNGELHRDNDLPSVVLSDERKEWHQNGLLHRENGPAIIYKNLYIDHLKYRDDDSYVIIGDCEEYYLEGKEFTKEEYHKILKETDSLPLEIRLTHEKKWVRERAKRNG